MDAQFPLSTIEEFVFTCVTEYKNYKQEDVNHCSFHSDKSDVFKYHAIFNQTLDYLGEDGKIPNFIALFSLSYLLQEFKSELVKIFDKRTKSSIFGKVCGDIFAILNNKNVISRIHDGSQYQSDFTTNHMVRHSYIQRMVLKSCTSDLGGWKLHIKEEHNIGNYYELVIEKLAEKFLKHLNINYINIGGFSPEFLEYATKYTNFPILIKALNK